MTNRFTKTSFFVQGGIMRPPSDGGLKSLNEFALLASIEKLNENEKY